ncbi:hypothetical protein [Pbunalikevirus phiFenriz]|jgi:hypothetical protein|uniref:Uncharacterized protein n=14 Tax=Pbunavirus PB1 TaxID=2006179 RepID=A0A0P0ILF1_9CAUD|nr:hypothetical protein [Pbunalikevirus phiVader]ALJ99336.1 hypothetical protein [Pbunalikevirus phiMoody]ALJ99517.1 hypothetical protein [Pbunalikevirus phiFenriz]
MGLVNLSWDDSVAGYMFGSQPCWSITDAGKKRILAMQETLTEEPEQQFNPSPCRHEPGKSDSDRLAKQLETIARLEKELEASEKRGSELAASYCDGVVGDEYGHTYCRYKAERDTALARVAELEGKLTDWVHEGFRLNEALAAAQTAHECTMGVGDGDGKLLVHGDHASIKAAQKIVIERDAALVRIAELESKLAETQPYKQHPQIIGYARKKELAPLLDPSQPGGSYIYIGLDHPACWAEEPPYEFLTPLYTGPVASHSVPDGYALIPVKETEAMHDAVMALLYNGIARTDTQKLLDAYINAATNKESV